LLSVPQYRDRGQHTPLTHSSVGSLQQWLLQSLTAKLQQMLSALLTQRSVSPQHFWPQSFSGLQHSPKVVQISLGLQQPFPQGTLSAGQHMPLAATHVSVG
jgi:hypothetical protein